MQELVSVGMEVTRYAGANPQEVVAKPEQCGHCGGREFHRHGTYPRWVCEVSKMVRIWVARFLCVACYRTTSRLPDFALSYRVMALSAVERFFASRAAARANFSHRDLLARYWRRWTEWSPQLLAQIGGVFGRLRSRDPCQIWKELGERTGAYTAANGRLITVFGLSLLGQYCIHARPHKTCF